MYIAKNLFYTHIWEWMELEDIIFQLKNSKIEVFIYDCITEFELPMHYTQKELNKLADVLIEKNIKTYILTSSFKPYTEPYPEKLQKHIQIISIPTYWLDLAFQGLKGTIAILPENKKINKLFFTLSNKPHHHRCLMIDKLYEYQCFEFGSHTWNILTGGVFQKYEFKHWVEQKVNDSSQYFTNSNNYVLSTRNYEESIFELVMESTDRCIFYTEKTFKAILLSQPLLIFGAKAINHTLTKLGFKLYDGIINYSFDFADSIEERANQLSKELHRLNKIDPTVLQNSLREVTEYNYNHALSLVKEVNNTMIDSLPEDCQKALFTLSNIASVNGFNELCNRLNTPYIYNDKRQLI